MIEKQFLTSELNLQRELISQMIRQLEGTVHLSSEENDFIKARTREAAENLKTLRKTKHRDMYARALTNQIKKEVGNGYSKRNI